MIGEKDSCTMKMIVWIIHRSIILEHKTFWFQELKVHNIITQFFFPFFTSSCLGQDTFYNGLLTRTYRTRQKRQVVVKKKRSKYFKNVLNVRTIKIVSEGFPATKHGKCVCSKTTDRQANRQMDRQTFVRSFAWWIANNMIS
jgi:hypothetical protein